jgi:predicted nuclease of predicted toxin-antitoxin system
MNLLADESVDQPIIDRLRQDGHDVVYMTELSPSVSDDEVLRQANSRSSLLLTGDKDFGELVYRQGHVHGGVTLIRLSGLSIGLKSNIVSAAFRDRGAEMIGAFTVISPGVVRIRRRQ